jgi:molybdate transport system ATP-binding protein
MIIVSAKKQLPGFSLDVTWRAGREITVLFGPSGSGKTTLLRLIAGLDQPDEGRVVIAGRVLFDNRTNLKPEQRRVGFVFQDYALFPWLSVKENILFGIPKRDRPKRAEWMQRLETTFQIHELLHKYPVQLSGGEAQRVALVRALAPEPELLLLDEPFSAVHGELRTQLRSFIKNIQQLWNIPVILVTHDLTEAHLIGDRLVRLEAGLVTYEGPVDGLVKNNASELMAAY